MGGPYTNALAGSAQVNRDRKRKNRLKPSGERMEPFEKSEFILESKAEKSVYNI